MRERQELEQLRIVVEHLLEMRHQPALVDGIARETAAEMIVDAALADALQRELDHARSSARRRCVHRRARGIRAASAFGNFGAPRMPPCTGSTHAAELAGGAVELSVPDHDLMRGPRALRQPRHQGAAVLLDVLRLLAKDARHVAQHVDKARPAVAAVFGK